MGLFALAFISGYLFYRRDRLLLKSYLIGAALFVALVIPHILLILSNSTPITSGGIPSDQWVKSTRIFSYHWYPITMNLFTADAQRVFYPMILLLVFFFVAFRYQDIKDEKNQKVLSGFGVCMILSIFGIIFSDIYSIPFLIRISLQRSTALITFIGILYFLYYLFKKIDSSNIFFRLLAIYSLLIIVFAKPGIVVLPLFLLLYSDIREGHFGIFQISMYKDKIVKIYFICFILLILLALTYIFHDNSKIAKGISVHLWTPLKYFNPFYGFDFLLRGGGFKICSVFIYLVVGSSLITFAVIVAQRFRRTIAVTMIVAIFFFMISISTIWHLKRDKYFRWHNQYVKIASSYLDVQLWAKENTHTDALFMTDPTHYYGWRDFSERSSFGNLREWGYHSIAYNPDQKVFNEGLKRMQEFGLDITKVTKDDIMNYTRFPYYTKFNDNVQKSYNNMSDSQLKKLSENYGIEYFIFNRHYFSQTSLLKFFDKFTIAYSNDHFYVFTDTK
jgi:hypothetical protein